MQSIRWGFLGAGWIAETFAADLVGARAAGETSIELAAVGARDLARAQEFADRFGFARAHGSYDDLVADPDVDAIYVATPHSFHHEQALLAIRAGKHVLVEKAFTLNAREAREIVEAAADAGVVVLEAMWTRFLPQTKALHDAIDRGLIGEPRLFIGTHVQNLPSDPTHRLRDPKLGGGALLDLGVYPISFAHDLFGAPTAVAAKAVLTDLGVDARTSIVLEHEGGTSSLLHAALDLAGKNTGTIFGSAGRIEIDSDFYVPGGFTVFGSDGEISLRYDSDEKGLRGMQHQAIEFGRIVDAMRNGTPLAEAQAESPITPAQTLAVMQTMDEVRRQVGVTYPVDGV